MIRAPKVTKKEETIIGKIPNDPFVGAHLKPPMMFPTPTLRKRGSPSARMKIKMRKRKSKDERAKATRTHLTKCSFVKAFLIIGADQTLLFENLLTHL